MGSRISAGRDARLVVTQSVDIGELSASRDVAIDAATLFANRIGGSRDVALTARAGPLTVSTTAVGRTGELVAAGDDVKLDNIIAATGQVSVRSGAGIFLGDGTTSVSGGGTINLAAQGEVAVSLAGSARFGDVSARDVRILADDLELSGLVTAADIRIESRPGALRLGGAPGSAPPPGGLWLDNTEFGRLRASGGVRLYGGSTVGAARGDVTLGDLDVNPQNTPQVSLFAGPDRVVRVVGAVAPTAAGGALRIGDAADAAWTPHSILVSGALGTAGVEGSGYINVRAFGDLRLIARNDILMGSPRFIALIQDTPAASIDIGRRQPHGVSPTADERFHVFVAANRLEFSANGKVVQQNTSPSVGAPVGIFLGGQLFIDPPQVVDLFGVYRTPDGRLATTLVAGASPISIVDANGAPTPTPAGAIYRFNSCTLGSGACSAPREAAETQRNGPLENLAERVREGDDGDGAGPGGRGRLFVAPSLLSAAAPEHEAVENDPVAAGTGNEEIWRTRRQKPK